MSNATHLAVYRARPDAEELLVARLWLAGTLGIEELRRTDAMVELAAAFAAPGEAPRLDGPDRLDGVELVGETLQPAEDWLARHRESARPREIGRRFLVDPREPEDGEALAADPPPGRLLLRVPARTAFGTGSHESTRLALELLEELDVGGRRVIDVGCGSGILAFAAARLGAGPVIGHDNDPEAALLAAQHVRLNRVATPLFAGTLDAISPAARFDLALVNILPEVIVHVLPALAPLLAPPGRAILSGILSAQGDELLDALGPLVAAVEATRSENDWTAYRVRLAPPPGVG